MLKIYKVVICAIVMLFVANIGLSAQTLRLVRTDVDSSRASFVTATYLFGIDVYVDEIDSCTAVSFDLNYTNAQYISFSEVRNTDFGFGGKEPVIITRKYLNDNTGYVYVGVLSGDEAGARGYDDPLVVHLEFAVAQNAPHGETSVFSFSNIQAVVSDGATGRIIPLVAEDVVFDIHSFISVWPGDADYDGEVTSKDVTAIGRFIGYGASGKASTRCFKRENASTIWAPQTVLAWDSTEAAHADCDGNGDVTVTDQLIVALNFGKTHSVSGKIATNEIPKNAENIYSNAEKSLLINSENTFLGVSGRIKWRITDASTRVTGFRKGSLFDDIGEGNIFYTLNDDNSADISMLNLAKAGQRSETQSGEILRLLIDGDPDAVEIIEQDFYAASNVYGVFPVEPVCFASDEAENAGGLRVINSDGLKFLENITNQVVDYAIYDVAGAKISDGIILSGESVAVQLTATQHYIVSYNAKGENTPHIIKL